MQGILNREAAMLISSFRAGHLRCEAVLPPWAYTSMRGENIPALKARHSKAQAVGHGEQSIDEKPHGGGRDDSRGWTFWFFASSG
jgi:hypothetical protein